MNREVEELRRVIDRADRLARALAARHDALVAEGDALARRLAESEQQASRLMSLYVAAYQLHASLDPAEVTSTIADVATHLLGFESFVLLLRTPAAGAPGAPGVADDGHEVALVAGLDDDAVALYGGGRYRGGDPLVDDTLADGRLRLGGEPVSPALAVVPLVVQGEPMGALVLLRLLEHKPMLRADDRDLLDLLAAHAATALLAARAYALHDRKLRTLESLVRLARGA